MSSFASDREELPMFNWLFINLIRLHMTSQQWKLTGRNKHGLMNT